MHDFSRTIELDRFKLGSGRLLKLANQLESDI
jgi:hypothetical protein